MKEKNRKFIDLIKKKAAQVPGPGMYKSKNEWKDSILGHMKGGEKITFISKIFKTAGEKPSPAQYVLKDEITRKRNTLGKINKGERLSTVSDAEYLSTVTPGAKYTDIYTKIKRGTSMPDLKSGLAWRVKKKDGPDPGSYPKKEMAFSTFVSNVSPSWKQGKGQRRFFTTTIAKRKDFVPGAGKYETIDYNKIHRRLSSKRH